MVPFGAWFSVTVILIALTFTCSLSLFLMQTFGDPPPGTHATGRRNATSERSPPSTYKVRPVVPVHHLGAGEHGQHAGRQRLQVGGPGHAGGHGGGGRPGDTALPPRGAHTSLPEPGERGEPGDPRTVRDPSTTAPRPQTHATRRKCVMPRASGAAAAWRREEARPSLGGVLCCG